MSLDQLKLVKIQELKTAISALFTSIYYDCQIINSEIEYSIIMEKSKVIDVEKRIERSILGKNIEIVKGDSRPKTQRFILADQSNIKL